MPQDASSKIMPGICERGLALIERATLYSGKHHNPPTDPNEPCECCIMELRAQTMFLCGLTNATDNWWTDNPAGDSRVITRFLQCLNDRWDSDRRQELKRFASMDLRDKGKETESRRMFRVADWAVRTIASKALYRVDPEQSKKLADLDPVIDESTAAAADAAAAARYAAAADAARYAAAAAARYAAAADAAAATRYAAAAAAAADVAAAAAAAAAADAARYAAADAARQEYWTLSLALVEELIEMGAE